MLGSDYMRILGVLALMTPVACVTSTQPRAVVANGPEIMLALGTSEHGPVLIVSIRNRSNASICIRSEALHNADTVEMNLSLRDARGRRIGAFPGHPPILEPLRETIRVEPGARVEGRYNLDSRFPHVAAGRPVLPGYSARARFRYGDCRPIEAYCDGRIGMCPDSWSLRADSGWRPL